MVEAMVVVGGKQSGNTRRLAHLAAQAGIDTFHVEDSSEMARENFFEKTEDRPNSWSIYAEKPH